MAEENNHGEQQAQSQSQTQTQSISEPSEVGAMDLNKQIEESKATAEKFKNEFLYLRAEFDNFRKHSIKDRSEYLKYGSERLIVEILNVLDNFERALETKVNHDNFATFVKGVELTALELKTVLKNNGVTDIATQGVAFDPSMHEALGSEPSKDVPVGHVVRVFKKPYKLHDKLIRPGQVVVASKPISN